MKPDIIVRLLPFVAAYVIAHRASGGAGWLGWSWGDATAQLMFAAVAAPSMFAAAAAVQLWLTRRRGAVLVPAGLDDAAFQAAFYAVNGPVEEAMFRGLVQGWLGFQLTAPVGFIVGTASYVLYHRLGRWSWEETFATALVGVPLGLAFWLLPGPPSLLGVSVAHIAATCGFLGPGPYLLRKLRLV
ncbi:MAG TPA: CPBP family glutamic-type intramembrane protease [Candidatus Dormibacteraeota bacterium]|nr:CPBP family glutamic-type intramembrane protease [Candidatus Dormibacteraeota bacterium]